MQIVVFQDGMGTVCISCCAADTEDGASRGPESEILARKGDNQLLRSHTVGQLDDRLSLCTDNQRSEGPAH